jgi:hypothetical protein
MRMVDIRGCEQCGTELTPRREHARFCSTGCRMAWNRGDPRQATVSFAALDWSVNAMTEVTSGDMGTRDMDTRDTDDTRDTGRRGNDVDMDFTARARYPRPDPARPGVGVQPVPGIPALARGTPRRARLHARGRLPAAGGRDPVAGDHAHRVTSTHLVS